MDHREAGMWTPARMTEGPLRSGVSHERGPEAEKMIAEGDEDGRGAGRREDVSKHVGAATVDDAEIGNLGALAFGDVVPAKGDVLGTLSESSLFGEGDGGFAILIDDRGRVLVKAELDAEFAEEHTFLCSGAEADDFGLGCVEDLKG